MDRLPPEPFGPVYPKLTGLDYWRKKPALTKGEWLVYGAAVREKIAALNRAALMKELPSHGCPCASGTWESDPKKIMAAVKRQNQAKLWTEADRKRRTDAEIIEAYNKAMAEKRARQLKADPA